MGVGVRRFASAVQGRLVEQIANANRALIVMASKCKKPDKTTQQVPCMPPKSREDVV